MSWGFYYLPEAFYRFEYYFSTTEPVTIQQISGLCFSYFRFGKINLLNSLTNIYVSCIIIMYIYAKNSYITDKGDKKETKIRKVKNSEKT